MSLDHLEKAINEISDKDWSWWPFLWLRPEKHVPLTLRRLVAIALLYGAPCAFLLSLAVAISQPQLQRAATLIAMSAQMFFFFLTSAIIGPMWNRRAERLVLEKKRCFNRPDLT